MPAPCPAHPRVRPEYGSCALLHLPDHLSEPARAAATRSARAARLAAALTANAQLSRAAALAYATGDDRSGRRLEAEARAELHPYPGLAI